MLCFLLQPKFTLDGTPAINFLVQAQWCWFLHLDLQCPFITAHTTDRDRSFLIAVFMLCMLLNDVKVVHTDWHAKISGQFYNWIFSFKSALLENVANLLCLRMSNCYQLAKFRTMVPLTKDVSAEISNHWCDFRRRFSAQRIKNVILYVLTCCQCTWPYSIRCRHNNEVDSLHTDLPGRQWLWFFVWKSMNAGFHLQRYPHRAAITHTSIIGFYTTNATHY